MGEIYLSKLEREAGFEKIMVIKRILPTLNDDPAFVAMFNREACIAAQLIHQNIVQIFDYGQHKGNYFIAMEYVHGRDLRTLIESAAAREEVLSPSVTLAIISDACSALDYAHRYKGLDGRPVEIIHRDVSPQNIHISYEGAVKLTDFGLAQRIDVDSVRDGQVQGKFAYMSPEQTFGDKLDRRSDIFSLGIVAYEMFCGARPFVSKDLPALMLSIRKGDYIPPSKLNSDLPEALDDILAKALASHAEDRYPDARAFQSALNTLGRAMGWLSDPGEIGASISRLCPDRPDAIMMNGNGGTQVSGQPIAQGTQAAAKPIAPGTQAAARPIEAPGVEPIHTATTSPDALGMKLASADTDPAGLAERQHGVIPAGSQPSLSGPTGELPVEPIPVAALPESRRTLTRYAAIGGLVLLAGIVGALAVTSTEEQEVRDWTLDIRAVPEGAEVYINNEKRGIAPLTVRNLEGEKTVNVRIVREGFKPFTRTIALTRGGGVIPLDPTLEPEPAIGTLILTVQPANALVKLNNTLLRDDSLIGQGRYKVSRGSGTASLTVYKDGYIAEEQSIEVPTRSTLSMSVALKPSPMWVVVRAARSNKKINANIHITGPDSSRVTCDSLPCRRKMVDAGNVTVSAMVDGMSRPWISAQSGDPGHSLVFVVPTPERQVVQREIDARFTASIIPAKGESLGLVGARLEKNPQGAGRARLPDGKTITLRYVFDEDTRKVTFTVGSSPYSEVHLNGNPLGNTPQTHSVGPGAHTLYLSGLEAKIRLNFTFR